MRYRFINDTLQLVRYEITVTQPQNETPSVYTAADDAERDELLRRYPDAVVTTVDNTGYEWLDGIIMSNEEYRAGKLGEIIAMGEEAYTEMKNAPTQEQINAMLMLEIAKMKAGVVNE